VSTKLSKRAQTEILTIVESKGDVSPEDVLERARSPRSALHGLIEWDVRKAGLAYQLEQARDLIRQVRVIFYRDDLPPLDVRALLSVEADGRRVFKSVQAISEDGDLRRQVMQQMKLDVERLVAKYNTFKEFWPLLRATLRRKRKRSA